MEKPSPSVGMTVKVAPAGLPSAAFPPSYITRVDILTLIEFPWRGNAQGLPVPDIVRPSDVIVLF
jgi:hypothetical protein